MQPRLMRSRNEVVIAGVCGGIGEYFGIDPVIVRLIFVLVALTTGIGVLVYPVLWAIMPPAPAGPPVSPEQGADEVPALEAREGDVAARTVIYQQAAMRQGRPDTPAATYAEVPPPSAYKFDPLTGEPLRPSTGATVQLPDDPTAPRQEPIAPAMPPAVPAARQRRHSWPVLGILLVGIGIIALGDALGIPTDFVFPVLMIAAGAFLLLRKR